MGSFTCRGTRGMQACHTAKYPRPPAGIAGSGCLVSDCFPDTKVGVKVLGTVQGTCDILVKRHAPLGLGHPLSQPPALPLPRPAPPAPRTRRGLSGSRVRSGRKSSATRAQPPPPAPSAALCAALSHHLGAAFLPSPPSCSLRALSLHLVVHLLLNL